MKLSVILVSYNVKYYLEQCIRSVVQATRQIESEIWVVDNASTDGSVAYLRSLFPQVHYIENADNVGFSKANNQAIRQATGEYVLLLNPDTVVGEDVLAYCIRFLDATPEAGATGVAMLQANGSFAWESRRGLPTPFTSFCKMSGLASLFPYSRTFGRYYMRYLDRHQENEIEVISGAFNMLRHSVLDRIGLLDERFFMYGEDIDLSYRVLLGGYKNYYLPVSILHYKGESTQKSSFRYVHVFYQAMLLFFNKHYKQKHRFLSFLIHAAVVLRGSLDYVKNNIQALAAVKRQKQVQRRYTFLCVGSATALAGMKEILERHHFQADYVQMTEETSPEGHCCVPSRPGRRYDYVVYDTDSFRFQTLLRLLARQTPYPILLATYSVHNPRILTHQQIWE